MVRSMCIGRQQIERAGNAEKQVQSHINERERENGVLPAQEKARGDKRDVRGREKKRREKVIARTWNGRAAPLANALLCSSTQVLETLVHSPRKKKQRWQKRLTHHTISSVLGAIQFSYGQ